MDNNDYYGEINWKFSENTYDAFNDIGNDVTRTENEIYTYLYFVSKFGNFPAEPQERKSIESANPNKLLNKKESNSNESSANENESNKERDESAKTEKSLKIDTETTKINPSFPKK